MTPTLLDCYDHCVTSSLYLKWLCYDVIVPAVFQPPWMMTSSYAEMFQLLWWRQHNGRNFVVISMTSYLQCWATSRYRKWWRKWRRRYVIMTSSYLQCFSRCSRKCRRDSPSRRRDGGGGRQDGMPGRAGVDYDVVQDRDEQFIVVKVSNSLLASSARVRFSAIRRVG